MTLPKITQSANVCLAPTLVPSCCSVLLPPGAEARLPMAEVLPARDWICDKAVVGLGSQPPAPPPSKKVTLRHR